MYVLKELVENIVKFVVVIMFIITITVNFVTIGKINVDMVSAPLIQIRTINNHYYQNSIIHQIVEK